MAIISLNPDAVREYSLKEDVGPEKTVFLLGALDTFTLNQIGKDSGLKEEIDEEMAAGNLTASNMEESFEKKPSKHGVAVCSLTVIHGLKGWKNFSDEEGKPVPFETETLEVELLGPRAVMKRTLLRRFTVAQIAELARAIQENSSLSKAERGN